MYLKKFIVMACYEESLYSTSEFGFSYLAN